MGGGRSNAPSRTEQQRYSRPRSPTKDEGIQHHRTASVPPVVKILPNLRPEKAAGVAWSCRLIVRNVAQGAPTAMPVPAIFVWRTRSGMPFALPGGGDAELRPL